MKKRTSKLMAILLIVALLVSGTGLLSSAKYTYPQATMNSILSNISSKYSADLSAKIRDLIYDSDYSDILSDKTTLRSYETIGRKAWPITNADNFGTSVVDRGKTVNYGWNSAGCAAYAAFFTYSVYGSTGTKSAEYTLTSANRDTIVKFFKENLQPGEHIRVTHPHSIIFLSFGTENGRDGFYFCEYWGGGKVENGKYVYSSASDQYYVAFRSFDDFIAKYANDNVWIYNNYESSEYATEESGETNPLTISRSIVMSIDVSGSMRYEKIANTKTAAKAFVKNVFEATTNTEIALVSFADHAQVCCTFTKDEATLDQAIDALAAGGDTNIYESLSNADSLLQNSTSAKKSIILMSDGAPNEGMSSASGYRDRLDGNGTFYVSSYGAAIYDLCKEYKENKGYYIYTLGFGLSDSSTEYRLLENICTAGDHKFVSVANNAEADGLTVAFDVLGQSMTKNKRIYINLDCPIDVKIDNGGETMSSVGCTVGQTVTTSYGTMSVSQNIAGERCVAMDLEYSSDYSMQIIGTGSGTMDMRVTYENGDTSTYREYKSVPISSTTRITSSSFDYRADLALYIDKDSDGKIDSGWVAGVNETVTAQDSDLIEQLYPQNETDPLAVDIQTPVSSDNPLSFAQKNLMFRFSFGQPARLDLRFADGRYDMDDIVWTVNVPFMVIDPQGTIHFTRAVMGPVSATVTATTSDGLYSVSCEVNTRVSLIQWIIWILFGWIWF